MSDDANPANSPFSQFSEVAMEGKRMKASRRFHAYRRSSDGGGDGVVFSRWAVFCALAAMTFWAVGGCTGRELRDFQRGTTCSAENVERYATEHKVSYEQALAELRAQDERLWQEEEARQAKRQHKKKAPATEEAPASVGGVQLSGYREGTY
jgi:hypothetical protein